MSFIPVQRTGRQRCVAWNRTGHQGHRPWPWTSVLTATCLEGGGPLVTGSARACVSSWWSRHMPVQTLRDAATPATVGGNTHQSVPAMSTKTVTSLLFVGLSHHCSCTFRLLPAQTDGTITSRLRSAAIYPQPATRTKRFTSSINWVYNALPVFSQSKLHVQLPISH